MTEEEMTFELTEQEDDILDRLKKRIPYSEKLFGTEDNYNFILEDLLLSARHFGLSRIYPMCHDYTNYTLPTKYTYWQYKCCIELYNLADKSGFNTYSENGYSFGKLTDGISLQLLNELTAFGGVPKASENGD